MSEFGYAGKILTVDLSNGKYREIPSAEYTERFLGGRGIAVKLYWDMVAPETGAVEPDNCLICATGPVTGFFHHVELDDSQIIEPTNAHVV